jgi:hypothetical protein
MRDEPSCDVGPTLAGHNSAYCRLGYAVLSGNGSAKALVERNEGKFASSGIASYLSASGGFHIVG